MKYTLMTLEPNYFIVCQNARSNAVIVIMITIAMITVNQRNLDTFFWSIFQTNKQKKKKITSKAEQRIASSNNGENYFQQQNSNAFCEKCCFFRLTLKLPEIFFNISAPNLLNTFRKAITSNTVVICNFVTLLKKKNHPSLFICRYLHANKSLIRKCEKYCL